MANVRLRHVGAARPRRTQARVDSDRANGAPRHPDHGVLPPADRGRPGAEVAVFSWLDEVSGVIVLRATAMWTAASPRLLGLFGLAVMVTTAVLFVSVSSNQAGAPPGTVSLLQFGTAAVFVAGALCMFRVGKEIVGRILGGVVTGAFALSLVTLSASLPAGVEDPYATLWPAYIASVIALIFLALREGFR